MYSTLKLNLIPAFTPMIMIVTPLAATAISILYVRLALDVITIRKREKIGLGSAGNEPLERACRAHANLTEWAPIGLILIAALELNNTPIWLSALPAIAFVAGRALHPKGMTSTEPGAFKQRTLGMQLTIYGIIALASLNVLWMVYRLFTS